MSKARAWLTGLVIVLAAGPALAEEPPSLIPLTLEGWPEVVASYRPNVLVVDVWASWCSPCIERFPAMIDLANQYDDQGVAFISLNLDDPDDPVSIDWSNEFLARLMPPFANYHITNNMMESFKRLNLLGIPVVLVYDGQGEERYRLTGDNPNQQFGEDDVENAVKALIAEAGVSPQAKP